MDRLDIVTTMAGATSWRLFHGDTDDEEEEEEVAVVVAVVREVGRVAEKVAVLREDGRAEVDKVSAEACCTYEDSDRLFATADSLSALESNVLVTCVTDGGTDCG